MRKSNCSALDMQDKNTHIQAYLSRSCRAIDERSPEGLQALKMVAVYMAKKAGKWRWPVWILAKIVDWLFSFVQLLYGSRAHFVYKGIL